MQDTRAHLRRLRLRRTCLRVKEDRSNRSAGRATAATKATADKQSQFDDTTVCDSCDAIDALTCINDTVACIRSGRRAGGFSG